MTNRDSVNHPSHYTAYKGLEVIDLTEQMNFNRGNAVKYISRAGLKNADTEVEDLKKAAWYINREIERITGNRIDSPEAKPPLNHAYKNCSACSLHPCPTCNEWLISDDDDHSELFCPFGHGKMKFAPGKFQGLWHAN